MPWIILGLVFGSVAGATYVALMPAAGSDPQLLRRLREMRRAGLPQPAVRAALEDELQVPFMQRVLGPLLESVGKRLQRLTPGRVREKLQRRLAAAGHPLDPGRFVLVKALLTGGLVALSMPLSVRAGLPLGLIIALPIALLGWQLPEVWLSRRAEDRKQAMARALPDVMDLLTVSVEAGLGFDGAIQKVSDKFPDPVAGEFRQYLKEIRLGRSRVAALRALAERSPLPSLRAFVAAVIQADQLGASLSKVLRAQSEAMRIKRRQRAEEKAMQLPLKLLFPLILFIFPSLFVIILGPAVITTLQAFAGGR